MGRMFRVIIGHARMPTGMTITVMMAALATTSRTIRHPSNAVQAGTGQQLPILTTAMGNLTIAQDIKLP